MKSKVKLIVSIVISVVALALQTYMLTLADVVGNLYDVWAWLVGIAYICHAVSIVFAWRKFSCPLGLASSVLFLVGTIICDVEFWVLALIFFASTALPAWLRK